jgi:TetR/AcrR family fatty acid metabolism transcriptional regulator
MKRLTPRQKEIIAAALDIVAEQGIQRLTIKNLARAVKVSEPALYRHFRSKYDILISIIAWYKQFFIEMANKMSRSEQPAVDKIGSLYQEMFRSFVERPALSIVIFSEDLFRYDKKLSQEVFSIIEMTHERIQGMLREGVRQGEIRLDIPLKQMSWMVMGTMRLLITKWRISGYTLDLVREGRNMLMFLRKVLKA